MTEVEEIRRELHDAVAARRRAEAALAIAEDRLGLVMRGAPLVAIELDADAAPIWGHAFGRAVDVDRAGFEALFASGDHARLVAAARAVLASRHGARIELGLVGASGPRIYDVRIEPRPAGVAAVGFDLTPSKLAEAALLEADRRKDEFLATLSHELRNPLTPLRVALDVAALADGDPAQRAQTRAIMQRQVEQLTALVDELLDLSRIAQGKLELAIAPLDPASLVEAALEAMQPRVGARHHRLRVALPDTACRIMGDRARLIQVLTNLLANALEYTPEGGDIALAVELAGDRRRVVFRIKDNGIGIAPELLANVFDPYFQSRDAEGRSRGGLGIGLAVVRRLVELHGGAVSVTSDGLDRGSEFVVELPAAP